MISKNNNAWKPLSRTYPVSTTKQDMLFNCVSTHSAIQTERMAFLKYNQIIIVFIQRFKPQYIKYN